MEGFTPFMLITGFPLLFTNYEFNLCSQLLLAVERASPIFIIFVYAIFYMLKLQVKFQLENNFILLDIKIPKTF